MECGNERAVMTQSKLISVLMEKENLTHQEAEAVVKLLFDEFKKVLQKGERIEIRGFGVFAMRDYAPYKGRNPKSGTKTDVPAKRLPHVKVGKELRDRIERSVYFMM
jgi:integration host factor subunit beta